MFFGSLRWFSIMNESNNQFVINPGASNRKYPGCLVVLMLQALLAFIPLGPAAAGTGLNGTDARPFYIFGHIPNTLGEAESAIQAGANAPQPDVQAVLGCFGHS